MRRIPQFSAILSFVAFAAFLSPASAQSESPKSRWNSMDLGPFQAGCFRVKEQITAKGIAIQVGTAEQPATLLFDPELLRMSAGWTGGFLKFPGPRGGLEGQIAPVGEVRFSTGYAPGWSAGEIKDDPRPSHQGHLPAEAGQYRGLYVHQDKVVLSYTVAGVAVLELPGFDGKAGLFTRTFTLGKTTAPLNLLVTDLPGASGSSSGNMATLVAGDLGMVAGVVGEDAGRFVHADGRLTFQVNPSPGMRTFQIVLWAGAKAGAAESLKELTKAPLPDLAALTKGGPPRWGEPLVTVGRLGTGAGPYVVDEITMPETNPFKSWLRPGGHDFLPSGEAMLVNMSGDVWQVGGLDGELKQIQWRRVATGLFQPLGCKIVAGKTYVLGRDRITRLHDLNADGEADYYENFNSDCIATENYHEFALDLQTDSAGNFYYTKGAPWPPTATTPHHGTMIRVSPDGRKMDIVATGLRAPNGMGIGPNGSITCSDNQGHWMPANRLNIVKPGGFYGMVPSAQKTLRFKARDGSEFDANPSTAEARAQFKTDFWGNAEAPMPVAAYDLPLVWMPQAVDNSPGGQVWVTGGKWGPWEGRMLHLSYGKCLLYGVAMETVDGVQQGAVIKFPFKFSSGIMRGRFSPQDGQLYVSGLNVWQSDAAKAGCFSRVRYTGKPVTMPVELHATGEGVQLKFSGPLDAESATDIENFNIERWNYRWTGAYGSPDYKVSNPQEQGRDTVPIESATLSADKTTLLLKLPDMTPCMQMKIVFKIKAADGSAVDQEIHNTIHRVPGMKAAAL